MRGLETSDELDMVRIAFTHREQIDVGKWGIERGRKASEGWIK